MREHIDDPMAEAVIRWRTAEQGGRRSGPPTAPVYMATAVFTPGDAHISVLIEQLDVREDGSRTCKIDFLVRELARPALVPGARMLVMEGPRVVAEADVLVVHAG
ncbi:hypothetical protein SK571_37485 [Lentzea sp. BCCO 10_0798]|uniref:Uncharacterized protein n=1 Tax=Lentzea kristufekii TaxID=3095430 RepID=A0ABU4U3F3_9PSEU|nr:hypothetical protein [Lentzea sp. BCCO 10_0798]MDX8055098.1 hypothetical protein [Lentzea sp. BCCO 10_0798]